MPDVREFAAFLLAIIVSGVWTIILEEKTGGPMAFAVSLVIAAITAALAAAAFGLI